MPGKGWFLILRRYAPWNPGSTAPVVGLITAAEADTIAIEVRLGNGWYRGNLGFEGGNANYGERAAVSDGDSR